MSEQEKKEQEQQQVQEVQESGWSAASTSGNAQPCPICLAAIPPPQESYLDQCFHKFCYKCIVQWTKVSASKHSEPPAFVTCPLCKTENSSIIYRYDGNSFERHYIQQIYADSVFLSEAHKFRLRCYYTRQGNLGNTFDVQLFWRTRKYLRPNQWLHSWVKREVQALLQEEDVDLITHHILGVVDFFLKRNGPRSRKQPQEVQKEFRAVVSEAARSFLAGRTERFVDEMELFLASGLNLEAYDEVCRQQVSSNTAGLEQLSESSLATLDLFIFDDISDETDY